MKKILFSLLTIVVSLSMSAQVPVVLVAGQSNTDGRVDNAELPEYIKRDGYRYCQWSFGSGVHSGEGRFEPFVPRNYSQKPERWAYDAVVYYELERLWQRSFYVIKESLGGTAIDPRCESNSNMHWSADPDYLATTAASDKGGLSLLKAFTGNIGACIDSQLSKLPEGYDIKFMLWHQGESDRSQADSYHDNLKAVVDYVRTYLVRKTGRQEYARLPFICGTFSKASKQGSPKVAAALYQLQQEDPDFHVVDVSDATLGRDQIHFDAAGAELLGKRMFQKILDLCLGADAKKKAQVQPQWPDGSVMSEWFADTAKVDVATLGQQYVITDYGVGLDSTIVQTAKIQQVIDRCAEEGGGVIVIPKGTFLSGALFFKKGTHLHLEDGGRLKGIDDIRHYPLIKMHMEGKMIDYFAALVTAEHCDGFTITGHGVIDGNGQRFWDEFWIRRKQNPKCTNLEALRPQLVYISHSDDVTIQDVGLINSPFWTNHLYRSNRVRFLGCFIKSPAEGTTHAPSSDAIDLDICGDVMVRGSYINICDDGVCLKGGKGTYVDQDSTAGSVNRVLVENCRFGNRTNAGITFGSEAWDCHNVIMRHCHFEDSDHMLLFKMRPDTPQQYGDVLMEGCSGVSKYSAIEVSTWTQFFAKEDRPDMPASGINNVTIRNSAIKGSSFFRVRKKHKEVEHQFSLSNFTFENIQAEDQQNAFDIGEINGVTVKNVVLNRVKK